MRVYKGEATNVKNRNEALRVMKERKEILEKKKRLLPSGVLELENINKAMEIIESLPLDFFENEPSDGLADEWAEKIISATELK